MGPLLRSNCHSVVLRSFFLCSIALLCMLDSGLTVKETSSQASISSSADRLFLPPLTSSVKCHCHALHEDPHQNPTTTEEINIEILQPHSERRNSEEIEPDEAYGESDDRELPPKKRYPDHLQLQTANSKGFFQNYQSNQLFGAPNSDSPSSRDDMLKLGTLSGPFEGPRRRKRDVEKVEDRVFYVYPENWQKYFHSDFLKGKIPLNVQKNQPNAAHKNVLYHQPKKNNVIITEDRMDQGIEASYDDYNPTGMPQTIPANVAESANKDKVEIGSKNHIRNAGYPVPWPINSGASGPPLPQNHPESLRQPGVFSEIVSRYIDFEINNHEVATYSRKLLFGLFIGSLIAGWIILGIVTGVVPITWPSSSQAGSGKSGIRTRNTDETFSTLSDRILLSLDSTWLQRLEEQVRKNPKNYLVRTQVHCCILPDGQTNGMVDCQLIKKNRKMSTFECLSDLIYNFEFSDQSKNTSKTEPLAKRPFSQPTILKE